MNEKRTKAPRPSRLLLSTTLILLLSMTASTGYSQTTCNPQKRCFSRAEVGALVDAACIAHRLNAETSDELLAELETSGEQLGICKGQLLELRQNPPKAPKLPPIWLRLSLNVGVAAFSAATGAVAGIGAPPEVVVGFAVASVGTLLGRVILEVVTWK